MKEIKIKNADNFIKRFLGLMFIRKKINFILFIKNCRSIHSFFMFQKIDVIMIDKNYKVVYLKSDFIPFRIILPKKNAKHTLECPSEYIKENNIKLDKSLFYLFN